MTKLAILGILLIVLSVLCGVIFGLLCEKKEKQTKHRVFMFFLIFLIFLCPLEGILLCCGEHYNQGLVDGAFDQLRGSTEVTYFFDADSVPVDTVITIYRNFFD